MATDEPEVETPAEDASTAQVELSEDGGDVAGRDPDEIAQEIEQTRAELADTIDAIAERISPKRAASRGVQAVKAQVTGGKSEAVEPAPSVEADVPVLADSADPAHPAPVSAPRPASVPSPPTAASRPIVPIAAGAAVVVVVLLWLRRRRSR